MNLPELILTAKGDRSYGTLSKACGGDPSKARLQQMVKQPLKSFPDPDTIKAMSMGLGVSEKAIVYAAAQSLGLRIGDGGSTLETMLPPSAQDLTPEQVSVIIQMVRAFEHEASTDHPSTNVPPGDVPMAARKKTERDERLHHTQAVRNAGAETQEAGDDG